MISLIVPITYLYLLKTKSNHQSNRYLIDTTLAERKFTSYRQMKHHVNINFVLAVRLSLVKIDK